MFVQCTCTIDNVEYVIEAQHMPRDRFSAQCLPARWLKLDLCFGARKS